MCGILMNISCRELDCVYMVVLMGKKLKLMFLYDYDLTPTKMIWFKLAPTNHDPLVIGRYL